MASIVILGANGMLGTDLVEYAKDRGHRVRGLDVKELDITRPEAVASLATGKFGKLDWVVNCAAYTAVDQAESEPDKARMLNALAPGYVAQACNLAGIRLIHISTDFVFDGESRNPYKEDDSTAPLGVYGETKLEGEQAVLQNHPGAIVARTSWLYGPNGKSFPRTILKAWITGKNLRVVNDQFGCPTYTWHLSRVICDFVDRDVPAGIYHATGPEPMTWYEFARRAVVIYREDHGIPRPVEIEAVRTEAFPTKAKRPKYSVLSFSKAAALGIDPMAPVEDALREFSIRLSEDSLRE